eukprot:6184748-Pleurochrysis_carterae.AAC.1
MKRAGAGAPPNRTAKCMAACGERSVGLSHGAEQGSCRVDCARTLRPSGDAGVAHTEQCKAHAAWAVLAWCGRGAMRPRGFGAGARTLRRSGDAGVTPGAT